ncbi:MAG TPA: hypothetical protein ENI22_00145 [Candidatus Pacearchaeota archaeon]|nr:hypothetical protein [Candidatus Pacearchaeota archaeon]
MEQERIKDTFEFLEEEVYLPGYMALISADYNSGGANFLFNVKEPKVTRGDFVNYFTPRGLHICVSQAGYALAEYLARQEELRDINPQLLRNTLLQGRIRITELLQRFRKEIELSELLPGRFDISKLRLGRIPILKLNFEFAGGAVTGNLISLIAPAPGPQINQDILRFNPHEK